MRLLQEAPAVWLAGLEDAWASPPDRWPAAQSPARRAVRRGEPAQPALLGTPSDLPGAGQGGDVGTVGRSGRPPAPGQAGDDQPDGADGRPPQGQQAWRSSAVSLAACWAAAAAAMVPVHPGRLTVEPLGQWAVLGS